jgi:hypothetical protein
MVTTARTVRPLVLSILLSLSWAAPATAQQPVAVLDEDFPWLQRTSLEQRSATKALVKEGNKRFNNSQFSEAEKKYTAALAIWEHPAIHYNLALALPEQSRPTEVYEHLLAAMQHGERPLGAGRYNYARTLIERMKAGYAWVEVSCACEASAKISSGEWLVRKKDGSFWGLVPPGTHTLVATMKNHPPAATSLSLTGGQQVRLRLGESRPYSTWKLVTALGAGAAVAAGGGLLHVQAGKDFRAFDDGINRCGGCIPEPGVARHRKRALTLQKVAVGSYALGGAAVLTSLVFLYNNQLQSRLLPMEHDEARLVIAPTLGGQEKGLLATFRF